MIDVNQKYDVGDKVVIKPWWLMVKQYGFVTEDIYTEDDKRIACNYRFSSGMEKELEGTDRVVEIGRVNCNTYYSTNSPLQGHFITDEMILGYHFEYGDEVEVSDTNFPNKVIRTFSHYNLSNNSQEGVVVENGNILENWKYALHVQKLSIEIDVKINGKDAKLSDISEETLKRLRSV